MSARWKQVVRGLGGADGRAARATLRAVADVRFALTAPLDEPPAPLLDPDRGIMVIWSAKAACSATFVWFLNSIGRLEEFRASRKSPHLYRREDYSTSDVYLRGRRKIIDDYWIVHVMRDPYLRVVSSYRQALKTGYADKRLRAAANSAAGLSFAQFLGYLETIDLARANVHHRLQRHRVEAIKSPDRVINISTQDLFAELARVERDRGLRPMSAADLAWLTARERGRTARTGHVAGDVVADRPFSREMAHGGARWPDYEQFLSAESRRRIERLYAADFEFFAAHL